MDIKVSVIIPVHNMEQYIAECLDSVVMQTLKKIEVIAVNDGSTDNSMTILEWYKEKHDNIVIITQANQGAGSARNEAIRCAKGKYLAFIDSDDFYPHSDCLKKLYEAAEKQQVSICGGVIVRDTNGNRTVLEEKRKKCNDKIVSFKECEDIYWFHRFIYLTDMIRGNNLYFPEYKRFEDPPFFLNALLCAGQYYELGEETYIYRTRQKKINYTLDTSIDILSGIRDVFRQTEKYKLMYLYENRLCNIYEDCVVPFYKYSFCGNSLIDKTIEEINDIEESLLGNCGNGRLTRERVLQFREESQKEFDFYKSVLNSDRMKIIYGAGLNTQYLLGLYQGQEKNIIGIAVTKTSAKAENYLAGYLVKAIDEYLQYREDVLVIIATNFAYQKEIEDILKELGFRYILKPNLRKLELSEAINE